MNARTLSVALGLTVTLAACGGNQSAVDRSLLYGFPDDAEGAVQASSKIRAQAEKDGGACADEAVKLHEASRSFELADMATDPAIENGLSVQAKIEEWSNAQDAVIDAVKKTQAACSDG